MLQRVYDEGIAQFLRKRDNRRQIVAGNSGQQTTKTKRRGFGFGFHLFNFDQAGALDRDVELNSAVSLRQKNSFSFRGRDSSSSESRTIARRQENNSTITTAFPTAPTSQEPAQSAGLSEFETVASTNATTASSSSSLLSTAAESASTVLTTFEPTATPSEGLESIEPSSLETLPASSLASEALETGPTTMADLPEIQSTQIVSEAPASPSVPASNPIPTPDIPTPTPPPPAAAPPPPPPPPPPAAEPTREPEEPRTTQTPSPSAAPPPPPPPPPPASTTTSTTSTPTPTPSAKTSNTESTSSSTTTRSTSTVTEPSTFIPVTTGFSTFTSSYYGEYPHSTIDYTNFSDLPSPFPPSSTIPKDQQTQPSTNKPSVRAEVVAPSVVCSVMAVLILFAFFHRRRQREKKKRASGVDPENGSGFEGEKGPAGASMQEGAQENGQSASEARSGFFGAITGTVNSVRSAISQRLSGAAQIDMRKIPSATSSMEKIFRTPTPARAPTPTFAAIPYPSSQTEITTIAPASTLKITNPDPEPSTPIPPTPKASIAPTHLPHIIIPPRTPTPTSPVSPLSPKLTPLHPPPSAASASYERFLESEHRRSLAPPPSAGLNPNRLSSQTTSSSIGSISIQDSDSDYEVVLPSPLPAPAMGSISEERSVSAEGYYCGSESSGSVGSASEWAAKRERRISRKSKCASFNAAWYLDEVAVQQQQQR